MSHVMDTIKRFWNLKPRGIIHVGANRGQEVDAYRASGIRPIALIEPLAGPFARLKKAVGDTEGMFPIQACCGRESGRLLDFYVASNSGQSSSYLEPGSVTDLYPELKFESTVKVETTTLDELILNLQESAGVDRRAFDYLAIDTQGAEHDVLLGATETLEHTNFAWIEVSFGGLYKGDLDVYSMMEFMRTRGFDVYYLVMRTKQWGDALFIRKGVVKST